MIKFHLLTRKNKLRISYNKLNDFSDSLQRQVGQAHSSTWLGSSFKTNSTSEFINLVWQTPALILVGVSAFKTQPWLRHECGPGSDYEHLELYTHLICFLPFDLGSIILHSHKFVDLFNIYDMPVMCLEIVIGAEDSKIKICLCHQGTLSQTKSQRENYDLLCVLKAAGIMMVLWEQSERPSRISNQGWVFPLALEE